MATLNGTNAGEIIVGTDSPDSINGNGGNDTIFGYQGDGSMGVGGTAPTVDPAGGGGSDDDTIRGGGGDDTAFGGGGDDSFLVSGTGEGFDDYFGGDGNDTVKALSNNTRIGLQNSFGAANSIEEITAGGNSGVQVWGQNSDDTWDFSSTTLTDVTVSSNGGNDSVIGSGGADMIRGGGGNDDLDGGAGNDMFLVSGSGEGFDDYQGGTGTDTIKALSANTRIGLQNSFNAANGIEEITADGKTGVKVWGQNSADTWDFSSTTLTDVTVSSNGGNDSVIGSGGADMIRGGGGNDDLDGGAGNDMFLVSGTGEGFDDYQGGADSDTIKALSNNTRIGLGNGFGPGNSIEEITADGNTGVQVWGQNSADTWDFSSTTLTDVTVSSNGGNDSVIGSGGADMIRGGGGNDDLDGGAGNDMFLVSGSGEGFDDYQGGADSDTIKALSNNTRIGLGNGFGPGNSIEEITADGNTGVQVWGQNSADTWDFSATTLTDVTVSSNGGNDSVIGSAGADVIRGGGGNDDLDGGAGADMFLVSGSGEGFDDYQGGADNDTIKALSNNTRIGLGNSFGPGNSIEEITAAGNTGVQVWGQNSADTWDFSGTTLTDVTISSNGGNDSVLGSAGNDMIRGGGGNDDLDGGAGDDMFLVSGSGEGFDDYQGGADNDTIKALSNNTRIGLQNSFGTGNSIEEITADGKTGVKVWGQNSADTWDFSSTTLTGVTVCSNGGNDSVIGSAGADMIRGGGGNDDLDGAGGDDMFLVSGSGEGFDDYQGGAGSDTIKALSNNTRIGLGNAFGMDNSIEEISADGKTAVRVWGQNSADSWDFSTTALDGVTVSSNGGDDTVTTALSSDHSGAVRYDGGSGGGDTLKISVTLSQALSAPILAEIAAYQTHIGTLGASVPFTFTTLGGYSAVNFESAEAELQLQMFSAPFDDVIVGTSGADSILTAANGGVSVGVTGGPPDAARNLILGLDGADSIQGGGGDDILIGGRHDDTMDGGEGGDFYLVSGTGEGFDVITDSGTAGDDTIVALVNGTRIGLKGDFTGANGIEVISDSGKTGVSVSGDSAANILDFSGVTFDGDVLIFGGDGADTITGNSQDNTIRGGRHDDTMDGGDGSDTYQVSGTGEGFDVYADTGGAGTDTIVALLNGTRIGLKGDFDALSSGIEQIDSNGFSITVSGDSAANVLDFTGIAFLSDITLFGGDGADTITGNGQDNIIRGGRHDDTMDGAGGSDTYQVSGTGEGFDVYADTGGAGTDTIVALINGTRIGLKGDFDATSSGIEEISAGSKTGVSVSGDSAANVLDFSGVTFDGDVLIFGGDGADTITGNGQDNTIRGGRHDDTMDGAGGSDTYQVSGTGEGFDVYADTGGAGTDTIVALINNTRIGLKGDFDAGSSGIEEISAGSKTGVSVSGDSAANVLDFSGVTFDGDVLIFGGDGADTITGNGQDNTIRGGRHDDTMDGAGGSDTYQVSGTGEGFDVYADTGGAGTDTIVALINNTRIGLKGDFDASSSGIEEISDGSKTGVSVSGDSAANVLDFSGVTFDGDVLIFGGDGADTITGNGQDNTIRGGRHDDTMDGGDGSDTYQVNGTGEGFDVYDDNGGAGTDTIVALSNGTQIGLKGDFSAASSGIEQISDGGFSSITVSGDSAANVLDFSGIVFLSDITLFGADGADTIIGNGQDNIIRGGRHDDTMRGRGGNDSLIGDQGNDVFLISGSGDGLDTMDGGTGTDTWRGGNGADDFYVTDMFGNLTSIEIIDGGGSFDEVIGTAGDDTLDFSIFTLISIEELDGAGGNDTMTGTSGADTIRGGSGDDSLMGGAGDDVYVVSGSGDGLDTINDSSGTDTWQGGTGADDFHVTDMFGNISGIEIIDGGGSFDEVIGTGGDDTLDFSIFTLISIEELDGAGGNDTMTGTSGADTIRGGSGDDSLMGGAGDDVYVVSGSGDGLDTISDSSGSDTWQGGTGADDFHVTDMFGNISGIEIIDGGGSFDEVIGTAGGDTLDFSTFTLISIEELDGAGGNDTMTGTTGADTIRGGSGDDSLMGGAGNDVYVVSGSGDGLDTISDSSGSDTWQGGTGADDFRVTSGFGNISGIEIIDGGGSFDEVIGTAGDDTLDFSTFTLISIEELDGAGGNDTMTGTSGADTIRGGSGDDSLMGGAGNDVYVVSGSGDGLDTINDSSGTDTWQGGTGADDFRVTSGFGNISGIEIIDGGGSFDEVIGTAGGDTLDFSTFTLISIEELDGAGGNDTMTGTSGADTIRGGSGDDSLMGGAGDDVYVVSGSGDGLDTISDSGGSDTWQGGTGADDFRVTSGFGNISGIETINGGGGFDEVIGTAGGDILDFSSGPALVSIEEVDGAGGDDTITASTSSATAMRGGAGSDTFALASGNTEDHSVFDFTVSSDTLDISDVLTGVTDFDDIDTDMNGILEDTEGGGTSNLSVSVSGGNIELDFGAAGSITLLGVTQIAEADLIFI